MNSERKFLTDKGWNWVRPTTLSKHFMVMEPQGKDTFECVIKDGYPAKVHASLFLGIFLPRYNASQVVSNRPDGSFATKDLFQRHPEEKDRYKYIGRLDDTLVHILGEKTNPGIQPSFINWEILVKTIAFFQYLWNFAYVGTVHM